MRFSRVFLLLASLAILSGALFAQPRIDAVQNNYSYLLPGNPNYGIAQGSIFIIKGANLANTTTSLQNPPLQTNLNGVTARVTVNGVSTDVLWYYVTPGQLGGILPSRTPVGSGTITVTNNGQTSAPAPIQVVQSAFGILTLAGSGSGAAAVQNANDNYQLLSTSRSAKPGDYLVIYGSGVGPTTDDESGQQTPRDMTNIPTVVEVGGVQASVLYRGRTAFAGLDQINIQVPAGVPQNCDVSLVVKTGNISSNSTTIPIAANGGTCQPSTNPGGGGGSSTISQADIEKWLASGQFRVGSVTLERDTTYTVQDAGLSTTTTTKTEDSLTGAFLKISGADLQKVFSSPFVQNLAAPTAGSCTVTPFSSIPNLFPGLTISIGYLDAGPAINISGPNGNKSAPKQSQFGIISYNATLGNGTPGNYLDAGAYTVSGSGGADVGAFSAALTLANPLTWTNRTSVTDVTRSQGVTVTWTGGDPNTLVDITGTSTSLANGSISGASFTCLAKNSDGRFTVPANILNQLPASSAISAGPVSIVQRGTLSVSSSGQGVRAVATGVDYLLVNYSWSTTQSVQYK